eukprot:6203929-Pleurochrysis_carterae.AAC.4
MAHLRLLTPNGMRLEMLCATRTKIGLSICCSSRGAGLLTIVGLFTLESCRGTQPQRRRHSSAERHVLHDKLTYQTCGSLPIISGSVLAEMTIGRAACLLASQARSTTW